MRILNIVLQSFLLDFLALNLEEIIFTVLVQSNSRTDAPFPLYQVM